MFLVIAQFHIYLLLVVGPWRHWLQRLQEYQVSLLCPQYWNWGSKSFLGYLSMHPLITLFSAYHILRTVNTKVLKLHIWLCLKEDRFIKTGGDFAMYSSNSIPHNSHFRVPCPNIILISYINSSQFIPHSSHFAVRTLDFTVHTSHFTVHTSHVIVYTSQFIVQSS